MKLTVLTCFQVLFFTGILAQTNPDFSNKPEATSLWGVQYHYGFIIAHSNSIKEAATGNPQALEINFRRLNSSLDSWKKAYCYNLWGLSFSYVDFGNDEVLGQAYNLLFYFEPILSRGRKFELTGKAGLGLGYVTKKYAAEENPGNLFFSTKVNFPLAIGLNLKYKVTQHWNLSLSANYNHISNGGMKLPNKGINYPTASLGIEYTLDPIALPGRTIPKSEGFPLQKYLLLFGTTESVSDSLYGAQTKKPLIGVQAGLLKRLGNIYGISGGMEVFYDGRHSLQPDPVDEEYNKVIWAATLGNNLFFGDFQFSQQFGFYIDQPTTTSKILYQRYALDYFIGPILKIGFSLKAHGHVADYLDLRIGVLF